MIFMVAAPLFLVLLVIAVVMVRFASKSPFLIGFGVCLGLSLASTSVGADITAGVTGGSSLFSELMTNAFNGQGGAS